MSSNTLGRRILVICTCVNWSAVSFTAIPALIHGTYLRSFRAPAVLGADWLLLGMPGFFYSSSDGLYDWAVREAEVVFWPGIREHYG